MNKKILYDRCQEFLVDCVDYKLIDEGTLDPFHFNLIFKGETKTNRKIVDIHQLTDEDANYEATKFFIREVKLYCKIKPYIGVPTFYGYYFGPEFSIVTEHFSSITLEKIYYNLRMKTPIYCQIWNDTFKSQISFGIACTMMHLHAFNILHGKLRSDIIFFDKDLNPKITQFAFSKLQDDLHGRHNFNMNLYCYQSPEVKHDGFVSLKSDVYSFGVLLLSITQGNERFRIDKATESFVIPDETPPIVSRIIRDCLKNDPKERPSFAQIVKIFIDSHPLFPETNEDDYRNFVFKYMQNVEIPEKDRSLFVGGDKTERKHSKSRFSSKLISSKKQKSESDDDDNEENENEEDKEDHKFKQHSKSGTSLELKSSKKKKSESDDDDNEENENEEDKEDHKFKQHSKSRTSSELKSSKKKKSESDDDDDNEENENEDENEKTEYYSSSSSDIDDYSETSDNEDKLKSEHHSSSSSNSQFYSGVSDIINFENFLRKDQKGDLYSMVRAGLCLQNGEYGAEVDEKQAFEMYQKAAQRNYSVGLFKYAICKKNGFGTDVDVEEAYDAMKKASHPTMKNPQAMEKYGEWLLDKDPENTKEALEYFHYSMNYGSSNGAYYAAKIYEKMGEIEEAKILYQEAGKLGNLSAYNDYAVLLLENNATAQQGILALKQNAHRKCPESIFNLGYIELVGEFEVEPCAKSAFKHFRSAAHAKFEKACLFYAKLLALGGNGVDQDLKKAAKWFKIAAKNGNKTAMLKYAQCLEDGRGVEQNIEKAAKWFKKAADNGNKTAMLKYAQCLEDGKGVEQNVDLADEYRKRSK